MSDTRELTTAVARGDPGAFAVLYEAWFDRCFALARTLTRRDEAFCLDVVQDVMLRVVKSLQPMAHESALAAWFLRVVHTTAIDRLRQEARAARREQRVAATRPERAEHLEPTLALLGAERSEWLQARIAELPAADQALWQARFLDGATLAEAGARVGLSGDAAHGRLWRLVERLRRKAREVFS